MSQGLNLWTVINHGCYCMHQGTSQVLRLSTGFPYKVLSLCTRPEVAWYASTSIFLLVVHTHKHTNLCMPEQHTKMRMPEHTHKHTKMCMPEHTHKHTKMCMPEHTHKHTKMCMPEHTQTCARLKGLVLPQVSLDQVHADNFVPLTNTLLTELQRRGVSRDRLLTVLRGMGSELPAASVKLLQHAGKRGCDVRILSDCNSLFIGHMLTGSKVNHLVKEVITNAATFVRVSEDETSPPQLGAASTGALGGAAAPAAASHKMVIQPRHPPAASPHNCPRCPANLCKGAEVRKLRSSSHYRRIIYGGDGANDVCAALQLLPGDVVMARAGAPLAAFLEKTKGQVSATVRVWQDHEQLLKVFKEFVV
jgi:2,3-diketo-5-methylthio-1-phosphopentane phosphatase